MNEESRIYEIFSEGEGGRLKGALLKNPYLRQAVNLGQLRMETKPLPRDWMARWERWQVSYKGTRLGDLKPPVLLKGKQHMEKNGWLG